jgi:phosphate starvation-inducible PhoH-like protein
MTTEKKTIEWLKYQLIKKNNGIQFYEQAARDMKKLTGVSLYDMFNINNTVKQPLRNTMGKKKSRNSFTFEDTNDKSPQTKKKFHVKDLIKIQPITVNQDKYFKLFKENRDLNFVLHGSAGTGKTFMTCGMALEQVLNKEFEKIVIIRSCVQTRDMGALPGDSDEKMAKFEKPYAEMWTEFFKFKNAWQSMKEIGMVEFEPTAFLRGTTMRDSIIIVDEAQSLNFHELCTVMTRVGENSRIIFCGDTAQDDLIKHKYDVSGLPDFMNIVQSMPSGLIETVKFNHNDIVRSELVKQFIITKEKYESIL